MSAHPPIPGEDPVFLDVLERLSALAQVDRPCLVVGERGTGKELFATRLHYLSSRWDGALLKVNCAALTESLLDSELFGHEAGAFTGAARRHVGCFERAHRGTLILDEIASASLSVQEKILRVIEYGELRRVGGSETVEVDVRIVAATNVDLPWLAERGGFRPDLLDRLAFDVLTLPPLRARPGDILPLAEGFAVEMTRHLGREVFPGFTPVADSALLGHRWPGNVRELKNVVERSLYRTTPGEQVDALVIDPFESPWRAGVEQPASSAGASMPPSAELGSSGIDPSRSAASGAACDEWRAPPSDLRGRMAEIEKTYVGEALEASAYRRTRAAQRLGIGYQQLRRLIRKHGLDGREPMERS